MDSILHDLRYGWRSLRSHPAFALLAVATLGLGIAASTAMFSVVHGVLLEPLPYPDSDRLVTLYRHRVEDPSTTQPFSLPDLLDVDEQVTGLESVVGYNPSNLTLTGLGDPEVIAGGRFTGPVLEVFDRAPALGRDISRDEARHGGDDVVLLSWGFYQERLGGDPAALGTTLELSGAPHTVIGVAPPGFDFPAGAQLWVPRQMDLEGCGRDCHFLRTVGRLADAASLESVGGELELLAGRLEAEYPETNSNKRFALRPMIDEVTRSVRPALLILLGSVAALLLIATANVANLVLVRGVRRQQELAVRSAVGASRGRLFRQLLLENAILALGASALGVVLGAVLLRSLLRLAPPGLPRIDEIGLDGTVLAFNVGAGLLALLLFGLVPAWRTTRPELRSRLARPGLERSWQRSALLASEIALSFVLLLGAGLLLKSFRNLVTVDLGFDRQHVLTFGIDLPSTRYPEGADAIRFFEQLEERLRSLPGVTAVGASFASPLGENQVGGGLILLDRPEPEPGDRLSATTNVVTPGFFQALEVPLLRGRALEPTDRWGGEPVVVVNQAFADRYYPGRDPIGERLRSGVSFGYDLEEDEAYTIVGVVGDTRAYGLDIEPLPELYMAQAQSGSDYLTYVVRSAAGVDLTSVVQREVHAVDPLLPLRGVETLEQRIERRLGPSRFYLLLLSTFASLALLLAAVGLYGVVSFLVAQRRREIAIRMALGAGRGRVQRGVLGDGLVPVGLGLVVGLLGSWGLGRFLQALLHEVAPQDPSTLVTSAAVLAAVAFAALLLPARRASRVAPMLVLRQE